MLMPCCHVMYLCSKQQSLRRSTARVRSSPLCSVCLPSFSAAKTNLSLLASPAVSCRALCSSTNWCSPLHRVACVQSSCCRVPCLLRQALSCLQLYLVAHTPLLICRAL